MTALASLILLSLFFLPDYLYLCQRWQADFACVKLGDKHLSHRIPRGKSEIRAGTSRMKEKIYTNGFIGQIQNIKVIPDFCVVITQV